MTRARTTTKAPQGGRWGATDEERPEPGCIRRTTGGVVVGRARSARPVPALLLLLSCLLILPGASNKQERRAYKVLEAAAESDDDPRDLLQRARSYLEDFPEGDGAQEATLLAGKSAFALESWRTARTYLESYLSSGGRTDIDSVKVMIAVAVSKEGDTSSAMTQLTNVLGSAENKAAGRFAGRELVSQLLFEGDWRRALNAQGTMLDRGFFESDVDLTSSRKAIETARRELKSRGRKWGSDGWSRTEKTFEAPAVKGLIAALALEEAGQLVDGPETEGERRAWAARFPEHPLASWIPGAAEYSAEEEDVDPTVVGLLIPESGRFAAPGQLVRRGVDLALMTAAEQGWPQIDLRVLDTTGDPEMAVAGMRRFLEKDKAIAVIGPLLSAEAEVVAPLTAELAMPTVMLSQRPGYEAESPYAFNGWSHPDSQIRAIVDHAIHRMGLRSFAIVYPNKEGAADLAQRFWDEVQAEGGQVVAVESYQSQETDFRKTARRMTGIHWTGNTPGESDLQLPFMPGRSKPQMNGETLIPGTDFQAIFVPDSYRRVSMLAPGFLFEDINLGGHIEKKPSVVILGGSALNHPDLIERGGDYIKGTVMVDGFFLDASGEAVTSFVSKYRNNYGGDPTILEASAYDATLFLCQLLAEGVTTRRELLQRLSLATPMISVTGARGFEPGGAMQHEMLTLQVRRGKIVQVWPDSDDGG